MGTLVMRHCITYMSYTIHYTTYYTTNSSVILSYWYMPTSLNTLFVAFFSMSPQLQISACKSSYKYIFLHVLPQHVYISTRTASTLVTIAKQQIAKRKLPYNCVFLLLVKTFYFTLSIKNYSFSYDSSFFFSKLSLPIRYQQDKITLTDYDKSDTYKVLEYRVL